MKNFEILDDFEEQNKGIIVYHEKESEIPVLKKRELVSHMWNEENAFGKDKHVLW